MIPVEDILKAARVGWLPGDSMLTHLFMVLIYAVSFISQVIRETRIWATLEQE